MRRARNPDSGVWTRQGSAQRSASTSALSRHSHAGRFVRPELNSDHCKRGRARSLGDTAARRSVKYQPNHTPPNSRSCGFAVCESNSLRFSPHATRPMSPIRTAFTKPLHLHGRSCCASASCACAGSTRTERGATSLIATHLERLDPAQLLQRASLNWSPGLCQAATGPRTRCLSDHVVHVR